MNNLSFIKKLYNGKGCYSDSMTEEEINLLHIESGVERIVKQMLEDNKMIFLTGNPGDGKTYIIRVAEAVLEKITAYVETDLNSISDDKLSVVAEKLVSCYTEKRPCLIAANEFPFFKLIKKVKEISPELYKEINSVRRNVIICGYPTIQLNRICIIDLNERNLLDKDRSFVVPIIEKFTNLLETEAGYNRMLDYNVRALKQEHVVDQLARIFDFIAMNGEHFVIRDILGTISFVMTACTREEFDSDIAYYDAFFSGENDLMEFAAEFDPVFLSMPSRDEELWNGEIMEGWLLDTPQVWPKDITDKDVGEATRLFKSIKRKYYFENVFAKDLTELYPNDYLECERIFVNLKKDKRKIKRMLIASINKLFLPTNDEKERLRIWTSLNYDLSRERGAVVSSKYVSEGDLDLQYAEPIKWLEEMEYTPGFIVMTVRNKKTEGEAPKLEINANLLRALINIKNGYPAGLLSKQYENELTQFMYKLETNGCTSNYNDGEFIMANRSDGSHKRIFIDDNKYSFGGGGDY